MDFCYRCIADISPPKGHKRPPKEAGGQCSSRVVHAKLTAMNNKFDNFFAEKDSESSDATATDDTEILWFKVLTIFIILELLVLGLKKKDIAKEIISFLIIISCIHHFLACEPKAVKFLKSQGHTMIDPAAAFYP